MTAANIAAALFGALAFIVLAKALEPAALGYLSYAQTVVFYLANFVDLGLTTYCIREVAKDRSGISQYVSEIVSFRILIASILYLVFASATILSPQPRLLKLLALEMGLVLFVPALASEWAFQAIEKMRMVFVSFLTTGLAQFILILVFVKAPSDLLKAPLIFIFAPLPISVIFLRSLGFRFKVFALDMRRMMTHLSSSLVIWSISMLVQAYNGLDILLVGIFRTSQDVAYFSVARRAIGGVAFLMIFLTNAAFPRLSATFHNDRVQFDATARAFRKAYALLAALAASFIILFARPLISLALGDAYLPAARPLGIMAAGLAMVLLNMPHSTSLIAAGFEKMVLKQAFFCAFLSIALNLVFIPLYGVMAAAVSFVLVEAVGLAWILQIYKKKVAKRLAI